MDPSGHNVLLGMHSQAGRKEWRAVTEGPARDRDGLVEHSRVNGSARMRRTSGLHTDSPRNGRMFSSGGSSGSSSDSDHPIGDSKHASLLPRDSSRQNGDDGKFLDEPEHDPLSNGHASSPLNGIPIDFGGLKVSETLEQRLHDVIRQREQLQRLEAELRAQFIARSEIMRVQNSFDEQTKQHASIVSNLQEQVQEKDQRLHDLEQKLEERERQLHANQKEASEAVNQVWAKDGLLREQTSELTTLRRERENLLTEQKATVAKFESERAQLLSQLRDLQDQLQEKGRQLQEMEEQHRTAQETLAYKDDQLREAQAWVQRAQELDAFYANSHNSLHAELRDRYEWINQLWLGQQRQLAEVERYHSQTIQRLRMEVVEVREQNRLLKSGSASSAEPKDDNTQASNGDSEASNVSDPSIKLRKEVTPTSNQVEHTTVLPMPTSPVVAATGPIPVPQQFQLQGLMSSLTAAPSQITQPSQFGNPVILQMPQLPLVPPHVIPHSKSIQQPQAAPQQFSHPQQVQAYSHFPETISPLSLHPRGLNSQQQPVDQQQTRGQVVDQGGPPNLVGFPHLSVTQHANIQLPPTCVEHELHQDSTEVGHLTHVQEETKQEAHEKAATQPNVKAQQLQNQQDVHVGPLHEQRSDPLKQAEPMHLNPSVQHVELSKVLTSSEELDCHLTNESKLEEEHTTGSQLSSVNVVAAWEGHISPGSAAVAPNAVAFSAQQPMATYEVNGKAVPGVTLLDEKSLLACLVRAIPADASARIKISTTLPNRLGKMLAPLRWHDYKKHYGRLDDFISSHPTLFVVDGDYVHLREGAHAIISATTAVAKVAAAAAAPTSRGPSWPPTVAVTPVAQSQAQRTRKNGQESFFSQVQSNGGNRMHQGFVGQKHVFIMGSRPDGLLSDGSTVSSLEFVEASDGPYGSTNKNNTAIYGSKQGARSSAMEADPFMRRDFTGFTQP